MQWPTLGDIGARLCIQGLADPHRHTHSSQHTRKRLSQPTLPSFATGVCHRGVAGDAGADLRPRAHLARTVHHAIVAARNPLSGQVEYVQLYAALFGFDEAINEFCSQILGVDPWDGYDLNLAIANRCRDARWPAYMITT